MVKSKKERLKTLNINLEKLLILDKVEKTKAVVMILDKAKATQWPIWRRWCNLENQTVAASEYTVWETIAPAASVTGYLLAPGNSKPTPQRPPAKALSDLPGYWVLP